MGHFPSSIPAPNAAFNYLGNLSTGGTWGDFSEGKNKAQRPKCKCRVWVTTVRSVVGVWAVQTDVFLCEWLIPSVYLFQKFLITRAGAGAAATQSPHGAVWDPAGIVCLLLLMKSCDMELSVREVTR